MLLAQEPWYLSTADRGRRRLFPRGIVALFAFVMTLVGWLALPSQSLQERLANASESDSLTVTYLHAWLNAAPGNWQLRMTLARHEVLLGHDDAALRTLAMIRAKGPHRLHHDVEHLRVSVLERMAFREAEGSPRRAQLLATLADLISRLARQSEDPIQLEAYYHRAQAIRAPWLAAQILTQLSGLGIAPGRLEQVTDPDRVVEYARAAIGLGDFGLAARLYWRAFDASSSPALRLRFLDLVASSETSGARLPEFFVELEPRLPRIERDVALNRRLARLALSANRPDLAQRFAREMLKFSGGLSAYLVASLDRMRHQAWVGLGELASALSPIRAAHAGMLYEDDAVRAVDQSPAMIPAPFAHAIEPAAPSAPASVPASAAANVASSPAPSRLSPSFPTEGEVGEPEVAASAPASDPDPLAGLLQRLGEWQPDGALAHKLLAARSHPAAGPSDEPTIAEAAPAPSLAPVATTVETASEPALAQRAQAGDEQSMGEPVRPAVEQTVTESVRVAVEPTLSAPHQTTSMAGTQQAAPSATSLASVAGGDGELGRGVGPADDPIAALIENLNRSAERDAIARRDTELARRALQMPTLAFDDEAYRLAFEIFVANGNLDDAYAVALSATEQVPQSWVWHIRVAEVAEWSQRPIEAPSSWHHLAQATGESRFWNHVERLAVGLRDLGKLNEFLNWRLAHAPGDLQALLRLAENYEAQGRAHESVALIRERPNAAADSQTDFKLRTALADVADRSGDTELLLLTLREMDVRFGPDPTRSARQARVLEQAGRQTEAFDAMLAALSVARMPDRHGAEQERSGRYWQTLARLAQGRQRTALALECYVRILRLDAYDPTSLRDLADLLRPTLPARAAEAYAHGFHKFRDVGMAYAAIGSWFEAGRPSDVQDFLASLPSGLSEHIVRDVGYLKQRGAYHQSANRLDEAFADFTEVYRLNPADMENRAGMLWTLLAQRDDRRLRATLDAWSGEARKQPALWGPYGAALLALDEPTNALPYFVWQARESDDYLWWLAYADALEMAGRSDAAWQLRRRAWTELRNRPEPERPIDPMIRSRVVALAMRFSPADEARGLLRTLIREVAGMTESAQRNEQAGSLALIPEKIVGARGSSDEAQTLAARLNNEIDRIETLPLHVGNLLGPSGKSDLHTLRIAASELAVSYLITQESNDAARAWLLSRYAKDLARPAWADLAMALTQRDDHTLDHLLATVSDWLPKLDRIEAERRLGRYASAQTLAFETASARPDSDTAHAKLVDTMMSDAPSAGLSVSSEHQGALARTVIQSDAALSLNQHSKLYGFARRTRQRSSDPALLGDVPDQIRDLGMGLVYKRPQTELRLELGQRDAGQRSGMARAIVRHNVDARLDLEASAGRGLAATESAALAAIGERDHLQFGGRWNMSTRDYLKASLEGGRWRSQLGGDLGKYGRASLEYGHRFRIDYPDLTLRTVLSHLQIDAGGPADALVRGAVPAGVAAPLDAVLPASGAQLDVYATAGATNSSGYTRGARPFAELGLHMNEVSGSSISASAGINSSVLGTDQLTLFAAYSRDATGAGRGTHELGVAYRFFY
ncbi:MAG: tetratricopeptide repeat protein [Burkholderiaceae bacterium]